MPFQYVLANLLSRTPDALGVIFLDDCGETVELASVEWAPFDLRVIGAYLGIYLRQTGAVLEESFLGTPQLVHIEHDNVHLHLMPLPDGYYLALLQKTPTILASTRHAMEQAAEELRREVFG
jgi:predicted regulator of Ras-like GTPase activity (Roadblock/LC7/MglB family)